MKYLVAGLLAASFLFSTGCNQSDTSTNATTMTKAGGSSADPSTAASAGVKPIAAAPAETLTGKAADAVKAIRDETGITFTTAGFDVQPKSDGDVEMYLPSGGGYLVIASTTTDLKGSTAAGVADLSRTGKDVKPEAPEADSNFNDLKGVMTMGTMVADKPVDYVVCVIDGGSAKKLGIEARGDLKKSDTFDAFMKSLKKK